MASLLKHKVQQHIFIILTESWKHRLIYSLHNSKARLPHSLSYENLATHILIKFIIKVLRDIEEIDNEGEI